MMIEKKIEKAVMDKLSAINLKGVDIDGFWQTAPGGAVKGMERPEARAVLRVAASPAAFEAFSSPKAEVSVAIALVIRQDISPSGEAIEELTAPVFAMLEGWQMSVELVKNDFTIEGFIPCGIRLDGGGVEPPTANNTWVITQKFTLKGVVNRRR